MVSVEGEAWTAAVSNTKSAVKHKQNSPNKVELDCSSALKITLIYICNVLL